MLDRIEAMVDNQRQERRTRPGHRGAGPGSIALFSVASSSEILRLDSMLDDRGQPLQRGRTKYDLLTDREREVLKLLADGLCDVR